MTCSRCSVPCLCIVSASTALWWSPSSDSLDSSASTADNWPPFCSHQQTYIHRTRKNSIIIRTIFTIITSLKVYEWWGAGVVVCLEQGANLHMAQLMPLPLTDSCFSKIQIGFTFLVPAHLGSPGKRAVKRTHELISLSVSQKWQKETRVQHEGQLTALAQL